MKKSLLKKVLVLATAAVIAIGMVGCGNSKTGTNSGTSKAESALDKIKSKGKLVIGTSADFPPYEFHRKINGEDKIVGIDIDIANTVAKDLGVPLEIKEMDFDGLLVAMQANKVDMIFSGMTPTDKRKQNADFSDIYYSVEQGFIMRKDDVGKYTSAADLKGKRIGVQKGSVQEDLAKKLFDAKDIKAITKVTDLVLDLKNNKVDAVLLEIPIAEFNSKKNSDLAVSSFTIPEGKDGFAIAMPKGSDALVKQVNDSIKKLKDEKKIEQFAENAGKLLD